MTHMVVTQIEFYFTVENLCRDIFLRSYMDEEVMNEFLVMSFRLFAFDVGISSPPRLGAP